MRHTTAFFVLGIQLLIVIIILAAALTITVYGAVELIKALL